MELLSISYKSKNIKKATKRLEDYFLRSKSKFFKQYKSAINLISAYFPVIMSHKLKQSNVLFALWSADKKLILICIKHTKKCLSFNSSENTGYVNINLGTIYRCYKISCYKRFDDLITTSQSNVDTFKMHISLSRKTIFD